MGQPVADGFPVKKNKRRCEKIPAKSRNKSNEHKHSKIKLHQPRHHAIEFIGNGCKHGHQRGFILVALNQRLNFSHMFVSKNFNQRCFPSPPSNTITAHHAQSSGKHTDCGIKKTIFRIIQTKELKW